MIEKNEKEINQEKLCWEEIEKVLKKYNCDLVGFGSYYDSDYDYECDVKADEIGVTSKDYFVRVEEHRQEVNRIEKEKRERLQKEKYEELVLKYEKYKNLKPYRVGGSSYFWFRELEFNKSKVKKGLFTWNPNKFWILSNYEGLHHAVSLMYDRVSALNMPNGEPIFNCFHWNKFSDNIFNRMCEWFEYNKDVSILVYQDMINICKIIDDLINEGVIEYKEMRK